MDIDEYKKASADVWKLFKQYCEPQDNDAWWAELSDESDKVCEKYQNTPLKDYVLDYVVCCMNEIARIWKRGRK